MEQISCLIHSKQFSNLKSLHICRIITSLFKNWLFTPLPPISLLQLAVILLTLLTTSTIQLPLTTHKPPNAFHITPRHTSSRGRVHLDMLPVSRLGDEIWPFSIKMFGHPSTPLLSPQSRDHPWLGFMARL
jgi:hypothetical protein